MIFDINDIANVGGVRDVPSYMLPPEVWTFVQNMRYEGGGLKTLEGWAGVAGTPLYAPHFGMLVQLADNLWVPGLVTGKSLILYTSLTKAASTDGMTHTDRTPVAGDFTTTETRQWNGTILGGIPIVNNGADVPHFWAIPGFSSDLVPLTNWPSNKRTKVLRAFGPFLVAVGVKEDAVWFPHRVMWSHPADPGSVPPSWDIADTTKDAGQVDLTDAESGVILDALPLASTLYIYKETSIWRMRFVGGQSQFDFGQSAWITNNGLLAARCVAISGDGTKHVFATRELDILWHNGNNIQSVLSNRQRRRLQSEIDASNYVNSFMFSDPFTQNLWFCYPEQGYTNPNKALLLGYKSVGSSDFVVTDVDGITFRNSTTGNIPEAVEDSWNNGTEETWDGGGNDIWDKVAGRGTLLFSPDENAIFGLGFSDERNGVAVESRVSRTELAVFGKKRDGSPIVDFQRYKMVKRLWPKIQSSVPLTVWFAAQQEVNGTVEWGEPALFDPNETTYVDPEPKSGRAVGFEILGTGPWRLDGYRIDITPMGEY